MYIFIDEYGNIAPAPTRNPPFDQRVFVLGALVIPTNRSRRRVALAITRLLCDQARSSKQLNPKRAREVKGDHLRPALRRVFFRRIARLADVHFYCILIDKDRVLQPLPRSYARRYNRAVANLLARAPIRPQVSRIFLVVDQGGAGRPTQQWQTLTALFKYAIKQRNTHVVVRVRESHKDRCLQAADVFTGFAAEGLRIKHRLDVLHAERKALHPQKTPRYDKLIDKEQVHLHGWRAAKDILKGRLHMWQIPPKRFALKSLRALIRTRTKVAANSRGRANRRG